MIGFILRHSFHIFLLVYLSSLLWLFSGPVVTLHFVKFHRFIYTLTLGVSFRLSPSYFFFVTFYCRLLTGFNYFVYLRIKVFELFGVCLLCTSFDVVSCHISLRISITISLLEFSLLHFFLWKNISLFS